VAIQKAGGIMARAPELTLRELPPAGVGFAKQNVGVQMKRMWTVKIGVTVAWALLGSLVYFASDAQFDALMGPATRDAIYFVLFVLWVAAIIMFGMIGQNLDAAIHGKEGA
jgi:hypothetical protein